MNFTLDDRQRSLRQYVALGIDGLEPYDLQLQRVHVADDERPAGLVEPATNVVPIGNAPTAIGGSGPVPQGLQEQQTFSVILYPRTDGDDVRDVSLRVRRHAQRLEDVFAIGLSDDAGQRFSPPNMVPVWDHDAAGATGADRANVPEEPYGWMTVEDRSVRPIQDPLDDRRWSIAASLRLSWWRGGRADHGPIMRSMPGRWVGEGGADLRLAAGGIPSGERWGWPTLTQP